MAYKRKTVDVFVIQQLLFGKWEDVTAETTWKQAKNRLKEYRENQPEFAARIKKTREPIDADTALNHDNCKYLGNDAWNCGHIDNSENCDCHVCSKAKPTPKPMLTTIPFSGFYYSMHSDELDNELQQMVSDSSGCSPISKRLVNDMWDGIEWSDAQREYSKQYAEYFAHWIAGEFDIELAYESMTSPKEYNFQTDRRHDLDCNINSPEARAAEKELQSVMEYLLDQYNDGEQYQRIEALSDAIDLVEESIDALQECSCGGRGMDSREYRYFNPNYDNYKGLEPEEIRKYCIQDYERMESLNNGNWYYMGIRAEATIQLTGNLTQKITSGGLWGIESDSGKDFIKETEDAELHDLRLQLKAIGFSTRAISKAFKDVKQKG